MDRREALKILGASFASVAMMGIAPKLHAAVLDDKNYSSKKRLVFYFTATGNSLFVAKAFSESPISIPQELKKDNLVYEADEIGFVFPDYAASAPMIVREFIEKATFKASYIFSVITYGNAAVNVAEWWDEFAKPKGLANNYVKSILMVDNYLPVFDMNQQMAIDKKVDENLARIVSEVANHEEGIEAANMGWFNKEMLKNMQDQHFSQTADSLLSLNASACVGCLTCADVCPHRNFSTDGDIVKFSGKCEYCLACVHNCPQKALTLKSGERNPQARFRNPNISLNEIRKSNKQ